MENEKNEKNEKIEKKERRRIGWCGKLHIYERKRKKEENEIK